MSNKAEHYKAAVKDFFKVGAAINYIVKSNGKVKPDYIEYADGLKPDLMRVAFKNSQITVLATVLLWSLNHALAYANGDESAKERCLKASAEYNELIKRYAGNEAVK
jgi:uncharacterized protein YaaR (DUF327 family)